MPREDNSLPEVKYSASMGRVRILTKTGWTENGNKANGK